LIVADTSALVAVLKNESDADQYRDALAAADTMIIGAPTKFELLMVMARWRGEVAVEAAIDLLDAFKAVPIGWDDAMTLIAIQAEFRFGKGRHPAALNFGDCMAYALAKSLDAPLLYKGEDFAKTDIRSAL